MTGTPPFRVPSGVHHPWGPNLFDKANVSVDTAGRLRLRIAKNASGAWTCAEIIGPTSYGSGTYTFALASRVDAIDRNLVLGLFNAYAGTDVPRPGDERVHLNFWLFNGAAPTNGSPAEVILSSFTFTP